MSYNILYVLVFSFVFFYVGSGFEEFFRYQYAFFFIY